MSGNSKYSFTTLSVTKVGSPVEPVTKELEVSSLSEDELIVKVEFASLNPLDPKIQQVNFLNFPLPLTLGFDFSGTVVAVGNKGSNQSASFAVNDRVLGFSNKANCFAEYVKVNQATVAKRGNIPADEAGGYGIAYCTAYESLVMSGDLKSRRGQIIYIAGGAGGVGHFAVQLAKLCGLTVISSGSKAASLELLAKIGVDHIIDYSKQDVVKEVLAFTGGKGVDFVYDPTYSTSSFTQSASVVASKGKWLRLGSWGQSGEDTEARRIVESRGAEAAFGDFGRYCFNPQFTPKLLEGIFARAMAEGVKWTEEQKLRAFIAQKVDFEKGAVQQALDAINKGQLGTGKTVIQISHQGN